MMYIFIGFKKLSKQFVVLSFIMLCLQSAIANEEPEPELEREKEPELGLQKEEKLNEITATMALGIGASVVRFDSEIKLENEEGRTLFIDPEGDLGLPKRETVTNFMGRFVITPKHSVGFRYFGINRESVLLDDGGQWQEFTLEADLSIQDTTKFYLLRYGYVFMRDDRTLFEGLFGLYGLDLNLDLTAVLKLDIPDPLEDKVLDYSESFNVFAPLPLFGINMSYKLTPRWLFSTKVSMVFGQYQDISAGILQTEVEGAYLMTKNLALSTGLSYFDAAVEIDDGLERQEVVYSYMGAYIGLNLYF